MNYLYSGRSPVRLGNAHPNIVPYQDFPTSDGDMILAIGNDSQFAKFANLCARPEWASDERYATSAARVKNRVALIAAMKQVTVTRTTAEWIALLEPAGVPCGPINTIAQVFDDPHVRARGLQIAMEHASGGSIPLVANPIRLSQTPVEYRLPPPLLGEHTQDVLRSVLGLDAVRLDTLAKAGVI